MNESDVMNEIGRRQWLAGLGAAGGLSAMGGVLSLKRVCKTPLSRIGSRSPTYSFWRYNQATKLPILDCIEQAADGLALRSCTFKWRMSLGAIAKLKRAAFVHGLILWLTIKILSVRMPRKRTLSEQALHRASHAWDTHHACEYRAVGNHRQFDELMKNKVEPRLDGYSDDEGFGWVIDSLEQCL